jgi:cytochrome d ubiquinol oxidase subunit II
VRTINFIFEVNYAVFSVFASLLLTEVAGSVFLLVSWEAAKSKVLDYVVPIWEVTGTFGAFWVVTSYFAYPSLLIPVASTFAGLLVVFLILFVGRNASIVFGEFITKSGWLDEKKLYMAYALSTLLLGLVVLVLLSSLVSGAGVDLTAGTFSVGAWAMSPGSIPFVVGALLIVFGVGIVFFSLKSLRRASLPITALGMAVSVASFYLYSSSLVSSWVLIPVTLTFVAILPFLSEKTPGIVSNKAVFLALFSITIFSMQFLVYPNVIGRPGLSVDSFTTTGPLASAYAAITAVGTSLLAVMLVFYVMVVRRSSLGTPAASARPRTDGE